MLLLAPWQINIQGSCFYFWINQLLFSTSVLVAMASDKDPQKRQEGPEYFQGEPKIPFMVRFSLHFFLNLVPCVIFSWNLRNPSPSKKLDTDYDGLQLR